MFRLSHTIIFGRIWAVFQHLLCFSLSPIIVVHYLRNHIFLDVLDIEYIVLSAFSDPQLFAMRSMTKTKRKKCEMI